MVIYLKDFTITPGSNDFDELIQLLGVLLGDIDGPFLIFGGG
jgi:hypothetical protein